MHNGSYKEGFWYSEYDTKFPMPKPNILTEKQAKQIYLLIVQKEKIARVAFCKGCSYSRIDNSPLGSAEYFLDNFVWPGDFAEHYVLKYRCKPTEKFLKFIGYK